MGLIVGIGFFAGIGPRGVHKGDNGHDPRRALFRKFYSHQMVLRHPAAQFSGAVLGDKTDLTALAATKIHF